MSDSWGLFGVVCCQADVIRPSGSAYWCHRRHDETGPPDKRGKQKGDPSSRERNKRVNTPQLADWQVSQGGK